jgi:hypothetical protein
MEAQTVEEEDFLGDVLDALVMKFPSHRPRGTPLEECVSKDAPKDGGETVTLPGP